MLILLTRFKINKLLLSSLCHIQAIDIDGEQALVLGFENTFPNAIFLCCFKHFQDNSISMLQALNMAPTKLEEIVADIFGINSNNYRFG